MEPARRIHRGLRSRTKDLRRHFPPIFVDVAEEKTRMTVYLQIAELSDAELLAVLRKVLVRRLDLFG